MHIIDAGLSPYLKAQTVSKPGFSGLDDRPYTSYLFRFPDGWNRLGPEICRRFNNPKDPVTVLIDGASDRSDAISLVLIVAKNLRDLSLSGITKSEPFVDYAGRIMNIEGYDAGDDAMGQQLRKVAQAGAYKMHSSKQPMMRGANFDEMFAQVCKTDDLVKEHLIPLTPVDRSSLKLSPQEATHRLSSVLHTAAGSHQKGDILQLAKSRPPFKKPCVVLFRNVAQFLLYRDIEDYVTTMASKIPKGSLFVIGDVDAYTHNTPRAGQKTLHQLLLDGGLEPIVNSPRADHTVGISGTVQGIPVNPTAKYLIYEKL